MSMTGDVVVTNTRCYRYTSFTFRCVYRALTVNARTSRCGFADGGLGSYANAGALQTISLQGKLEKLEKPAAFWVGEAAWKENLPEWRCVPPVQVRGSSVVQGRAPPLVSGINTGTAGHQSL